MSKTKTTVSINHSLKNKYSFIPILVCYLLFIPLFSNFSTEEHREFTPNTSVESGISHKEEAFTLINLHLTAFLQGPFNVVSTTMSDALRSGSLLPADDPYTEFPNPVTTTAGAGVFTVADANNAIVDWVLIEIRDADVPSMVLASRSALIQRDGNIVSSSDGVSDIQFLSTDLSPASIPNSIHLSIKHRNHLAVRTPTALSTASGTITHDFSTAQSQAYQDGSISSNAAMAFVSGTISKYCMWAGDTNTSGLIRYTGSGRDPLPILNMVLAVVPAGDNTNITAPGYYIEDVNMNSTVRFTGTGRDPLLILNNVLTVIPAGDNTQILQQHL